MSRGVFSSHNKVGETMSFQTDTSSTTTFDPTVTFLSGSDRVSWDLGIGNGYIANNSLSYSYPDTGTTKTVTLRTKRKVVVCRHGVESCTKSVFAKPETWVPNLGLLNSCFVCFLCWLHLIIVMSGACPNLALKVYIGHQYQFY